MKKSLLIFFAFAMVRMTFGLTLPGPAGLIGGPVRICKPSNGIVFSTDSISQASGYVWTLPPGATITWGSNTNRIKVSFGNSAVSGNISVYGTNGNGSGSASTLGITVSPYPDIPTITPPGPLYLCPGSAVNLSVPPQPGSAYCWYSTDPSQIKSWQYLGIPGFSPGAVTIVTSAFSPAGQLYVAFQDSVHSYKASVMKFDGSSWQYVGSPGFSAGPVTYTKIAFSPSGEIYIGFKDAGFGSRCTVMKFNGTNWIYVGSPLLYVRGDCTSIAVNPSGRPFLAYMDFDNSQKASVMGCTGPGWSYLGSPGFTPNGAAQESLIIDSAGNAYVAFQEMVPDYKASVMKYNGSNWAYVGMPAFSDWSASSEELVLSPTGQLHILYTELYGGYFKPTIKKFDGSSWVGVGLPRFTANSSGYPTLAFDPSGAPCVAYQDYSYSLKATVMKFNGNSWEPVGTQGFTAGDVHWTSINFSPAGDPYVAFVDDGNQSRSSVMHYSLNCLGDSSVYTVTTPGNYAMTITNQGGCTVTSSNQVTVSAGYSSVPVINGPDTLCVDTTRVTYSTESGMSGYSWTVSSGGTITSGAGTNAITVRWNGTGNQAVSIQYINNMGCASQVTVKNVFIKASAVPTIAGLSDVCAGTGYYSYITDPGMSAYSWDISPGGTIISGQGSNVLQVTWDQPGNQWVSVVYMNTEGCMAQVPTIFPVEADPLPDPAGTISGSSIVCAGSNDIAYSVMPVANAVTYVWTLPFGATITSGVGTDSIIVNFSDSSVSGDITVYGNNLCGNGTASMAAITVNPIPVTPIITESGDTLFSNAPIGNQWFYNGILLVNDTTQIYFVSPPLPGNYWTQVTLNGCVSDTSNHIYYSPTGFNNNKKSGITLYPNPATSNLVIGIANVYGTIKFIEIYNTGGEKIFETQTDQDRIVVNVENYPSAIYVVKVKATGSNRIGKFCKD